MSIANDLKQTDDPGVIKLNKYEPKIVEKMLRFIYQGDYDDEHKSDHAGPNLQTEAGEIQFIDFIENRVQEPSWLFQNGEALVVNIKVFIIAGDHNMEALMDHATRKYKEAAEELWNTSGFARSIILFYNFGTDRFYRSPIRRAMSSVIARNAAVLVRNELFQEILYDNGELATEVLLIILDGGDE